MLTDDEINYIYTIPKDKVVIIKPFSKKQTKIAEEIISRIKQTFPHVKILHMGASGLQISGQGDLDIYILTSPSLFSYYLPTLVNLFSKPKTQRYDSIGWEFEIEGFPVELYLTDPKSKPMQRQIKVYKLLKANKKLRNKYEKLKSQMNGKSFRKYQRKKYEFYHNILQT